MKTTYKKGHFGSRVTVIETWAGTFEIEKTIFNHYALTLEDALIGMFKTKKEAIAHIHLKYLD